MRGYGLSADAYHITQPAPDGRGASLAMQRALKSTGVTLEDVAYINAHATSTPLGDAVEAQAIANMFVAAKGDSKHLRIIKSHFKISQQGRPRSVTLWAIDTLSALIWKPLLSRGALTPQSARILSFSIQALRV